MTPVAVKVCGPVSVGEMDRKAAAFSVSAVT